jgi:hypothetical protein
MSIRKGCTFKGKHFHYEGDVNSHLKVYPLDKKGNPTGTAIVIDKNIIDLVEKTIYEKDTIQMGACRDKPAPQSLGEMLKDMKKSPQWLSYILPLLEDEGLLTHYKIGNAFWVRRSDVNKSGGGD